MSYFNGIRADDSPSVDAFGRWRTSETGQRFDVEFIYDKQPLIVDEVKTGNSTATHNSATRDVTLDVVETNSGSGAALYSHYDIPYTAGNSQLIDITATLDDSDIGGGTAQIFIRTSTSGSAVETTVDQTNWDDPVADVDWTKSQIFQIDFQSLKVGRIRYNLVRDGIPIKVHAIENDNVRDGGYWQNPTLPVYWRIYNDATNTYAEIGYGDTSNAVGFRYVIAANADATMRAICATAKSEGGKSLVDMSGFEFSTNNAQTTKAASTTLVPILSIQMGATVNSIANRGLTIPQNYSMQTDNPIRYEVLYRPTLTGASFGSVDGTYSQMMVDTAATAVTGGVVVDSGYIATDKNVTGGVQGILSRVIMSLGRTGTADILTLAAIRSAASDAAVLSAINWKEIR